MIQSFLDMLADFFYGCGAQSVVYEDAAYAWNNADIPYPSVALSLVSMTETETTRSYTLNIYAGERQREDIDSSTVANYEELYDLLENALTGITENTEVPCFADVPRTFQFAKLKMMDVLAVVSVTATFSMDKDPKCEE